MTILREGQFQIGDLIMGPGTPIRIVDFSPGGYDVKASDVDIAFSDEVQFGLDSIKPAPITFELGILDNFNIWKGPEYLIPGYPSGHDLVEQLTREWRGDTERRVWNSMKSLHYKKNGPQKVIYGRPRKFTAQKTRLGGEFIPVVMEYQPGDSYAYLDEDWGVAVAPTAAGTTPTSLTRTGGGANAWFKALIVGPITNPKIKIGNLWEAQIMMTLAAGKVLEVNAAPWQRRIVDSDSNTWSAKLIGAYLDEMKLPPNTTVNVGLSGTGTTAATNAVYQWREAYFSI